MKENSIEEAQKVLDELKGVRPEMLNSEAKRLFEAIMKIADERDRLKAKNKELEEENKKLKANHIITHNKVSDEEKAKIFDVIDNSIDTYFEKSKPYWEQIMTKDKMSLEEAEIIINDMYQDRNKILENNNVIDISRINDVIFSNLEFASVIALREIQSLERKLENSISVSLVEEKIEEFKEEIEQLRIERNVTYDSGIYRNQIKIDILQELLKKRK